MLKNIFYCLQYTIDCPNLCCADCVRKINESSTFLATLRRADRLWHIESKTSQTELPEVALKTETIVVDSGTIEINAMQTLQTSSTSHLERELKRHGKSLLICPLSACSAIYTEGRAIKMHFYEKHKKDASYLLRLSKQVVCFFCNLQFDTKEKLIAHNELHRKLVLELKCCVSRYFHSYAIVSIIIYKSF